MLHLMTRKGGICTRLMLEGVELTIEEIESFTSPVFITLTWKK